MMISMPTVHALIQTKVDADAFLLVVARHKKGIDALTGKDCGFVAMRSAGPSELTYFHGVRVDSPFTMSVVFPNSALTALGDGDNEVVLGLQNELFNLGFPVVNGVFP